MAIRGWPPREIFRSFMHGQRMLSSSVAASARDSSPFAQITSREYNVDKQVVAATPSPALFVFMDAVKHNVHTMIHTHCGGEAGRWRPHLKTTKMSPVYAALLDAGVRRFKCATVREAQCLLTTVEEKGVRDADLLVAYPHVEPNLSALAELAREFPRTRVSVLVEDEEGVAGVSDRLGVFVDVNVGMDRTGIPLAEQDRILATVIAAARSGKLRGLHCYDGHNVNADEAVRAAYAKSCYERTVAMSLSAIAAAESAATHSQSGRAAISEVVTSGSTTFLNALAFDWTPITSKLAVHTVSPGTIVFHDARYDDDVAGTLMRPGALILSRVISRPNRNMITLDAGSKGLAAEAGSPVAKVLGRCNGEGALDALTPSEEHLPMRFRNATDMQTELARGSELWLFPRHICPTVNMYDHAVLVENGHSQIVKVDARGH